MIRKQLISLRKDLQTNEKKKLVDKKLNAAIESNPASSIAIALKTQKGNYQFSTIVECPLLNLMGKRKKLLP